MNAQIPALPSAKLRWISRLARLLLWLTLAGWLLFTLLWGGLQLWIVPRIGDYRLQIEQQASKALGLPVRIGAIVARSDGLVPAFELHDVALIDPQGRPAMQLPLVLASLTPRSLWHASFDQILIERPQLEVRRLLDGRIEIAGLDFVRSGNSDGQALDWFFSQREFIVRGGTVRWTDDQGHMPDVALAGLDLVVRNTGRNHGLRLDALPPPAWGARFSVQGQFRQPLLSARSGDWRQWSGQVYADFPNVDVSQLKHYVSLDADVRAGIGAVRAWFDVARGEILGVTCDLALAHLDTRLNAQLEPLELLSLTGRLAAHRTSDGTEISAQNLMFSTPDGEQWRGGTVSLSQHAGVDAGNGSGELRVQQVDLAAVNQIASRLPLAPSTHAMLGSFTPRGIVESLQLHWHGPATVPSQWDAQGRVTRLEVAARHSVNLIGAGAVAREAPGRPGVRAASIDFKANEKGGTAQVSMDHGGLEFPGIFEDPVIAVDVLKANVQWKIQGSRIEVDIPTLSVSNADAQADLKATWRTGEASNGDLTHRFPGVLDLQGSLARVDGSKVYRYLPTDIPKFTRDYLRDAIVAGSATAVKVRVRGDLRDMPFEDARHGEFFISGKVAKANFAYVPRLAAREGLHFPPLEQLTGDLVIDGNTLEVRNASGRISGAPNLQITQAQARIPDLSHSTTVAISADVKGPLADMVGVVNGSALAGLTGQALSKTTATGIAGVKLHLDLPVLAIERSKVQGSVTLTGNDVQIAPNVPPFTRARGLVGFNESGVGAVAVQARFLGGDVRIDSAARPTVPPATGPGSAEAASVLRVQGTVTAEGLRGAHEAGAVARLAQKATGAATYSALVALRRAGPEISVSSNLQGLALGLPAPLAKSADSLLPVRFENTFLPQTPAGGKNLQDQIVLEIGKIASITYQRDLGPAEPQVVRGAIALGLGPGESAPLPDTGVVANVSLVQLDVDAWEKLLSNASGANIAQLSSGNARAGDPVLSYLPTSIAVRARELVVGGHRVNDVVVGGSREGRTWRANVDARELNGYVEYRQPGGAGPGRLYARLAHLDIDPGAQTDIETSLQGQPASVPALDIVVEDLELRGKHLGRVEVDAVNRGGGAVAREGGVREWRLNRLNISLPEATLTASGNWTAVGASAGNPGAARRTVMNLRLDVGDAGELLKRLGQPGVIRLGKGKLEGQLAWIGSPLALDYPSLGGQLNVNVESGQFLKADPGIAKLLGVLSLQSLPRRLALDFRDVFSEGFAFDFVRGDVRIDQGLASTNNLQMKGVNAAVLMEGSADIARETQDLKVVVVPEINAGTASIVTTIINPAVGLGTFLAQLFLRRPLIQANTQEFHVDGSWADPRISRVPHKPLAPASSANPSDNSPTVAR